MTRTNIQFPDMLYDGDRLMFFSAHTDISRKLLLIITLSALVLYLPFAYSQTPPVQPGQEWGQPAYQEYTTINKTQQWRYTQNAATLIISKAECKTCKPVSMNNVNDYSNNGNTALLMMHNQTPAMLRFYASPKGVNFRIFSIFSKGYQFELQLGINSSSSSNESFVIEQRFYKLIKNSNL